MKFTYKRTMIIKCQSKATLSTIENSKVESEESNQDIKELLDMMAKGFTTMFKDIQISKDFKKDQLSKELT